MNEIINSILLILVGVILTLLTQCAFQSPSPEPKTEYISYQMFENMFPDLGLGSVPDYRFYVVEKIETKIVEVKVPVNMPSDFRVSWGDLNLHNRYVDIPLWNPKTSQWEVDRHYYPVRNWGANGFITFTSDFSSHIQVRLNPYIRYKRLYFGAEVGHISSNTFDFTYYGFSIKYKLF